MQVVEQVLAREVRLAVGPVPVVRIAQVCVGIDQRRDDRLAGLWVRELQPGVTPTELRI